MDGRVGLLTFLRHSRRDGRESRGAGRAVLARSGSRALAAAVLASCSGLPPVEPDWGWRTTVSPAEVGDFAAGARLLSGVDAPAPGTALQRGDQVLFGLRILDGAEGRTWFVRVLAEETAVEHSGGGPRLRVRVYDERARTLADVQVTVTRYLVEGVVRACRGAGQRSVGSRPLLGGSVQGDVASCTFAMMDIVRVVEQTDELADLLWRVARRPSFFSMLGGVRVSAGMSFAHARPVRNPVGEDAAFEFPFKIMVNGQPALLCTVTVTEPSSPLRVCGGVVGLRGHAPDDPERRIVLRLLAARRVTR